MKTQLKKGDKKLLNAWAFYDWANSVYSLTIVSAVFPLFIGAYLETKNITKLNAFGFELTHTALITYLTAFGFLIVAFISPILSGIADYVGNKKSFLRFFCYMGSFACMGLYFFRIDYIHVSLLCYLIALVGFWASLVFYNSYLPDVAYKEQQDAVSAKGFSLGYVGSVILLIINLALILSTPDKNKLFMMRISFVMVGLWWFGFSHYTYAYLPAIKSRHKVTKEIVFSGFKELKKVWRELTNQLRLKRYLAAFFIYSMAVQTVMLVAAYFGEQEIKWEESGIDKTMGLIISILLIQLIAVLGAFLTSKSSSKYGNIKTLIGINIIWIGICIYAYFVIDAIQFFIAAGVVGLIMGGIQSLSRSTYSKFLPETEDTTSYFSFYDVAEKIGIVIGMGIFASVEVITGSMRSSILFLILFFVIGLILLFRVPKEIE
ncbi:MAG: MFS transporter [Flavobacteriaceae bacterium]|nr:MFS transporter [Flavobacteriaceae bacterium]